MRFCFRYLPFAYVLRHTHIPLALTNHIYTHISHPRPPPAPAAPASSSPGTPAAPRACAGGRPAAPPPPPPPCAVARPVWVSRDQTGPRKGASKQARGRGRKQPAYIHPYSTEREGRKGKERNEGEKGSCQKAVADEMGNGGGQTTPQHIHATKPHPTPITHTPHTHLPPEEL